MGEFKILSDDKSLKEISLLWRKEVSLEPWKLFRGSKTCHVDKQRGGAFLCFCVDRARSNG